MLKVQSDSILQMNNFQTETEAAIFTAQLNAYFKEANALNLSGAIVISLIVLIPSQHVPLWTWVPGLVLVYIITAIRWYQVWQHEKEPLSKTPQQWGIGQTVCAALAGVGWGYITTCMNVYETLDHQIIISAIAAVAAAASATEGFSYPWPSRAFIVFSLTPLIIQLLMGHDRLQPIIGVMLAIFTFGIIWHVIKNNRAFIETLRLRFENEFLVNALAQQRKIAEDASQAKTRFLAAASHDLRQPVQSLVIFHELLRAEMSLTPKGEHYFERSQQSVKAVGSLLGSLLDISKLDSNTIKFEPEPVCVDRLFDEMRREFAQAVEQKGLRLRIVSTSVCLETDPGLLAQILRNLISNALRYTHSGSILIGCRHRQNQLAIEVWDTGIGIQAEHQQAIFGEFFQIANKERDRQQGLGLGLAIVDRAAKIIGATVTVRSRFGQGSCFSINLPLEAKIATAPITSPTELETTDLNLIGRLIVVVENEELIRHGIQSLLEQWGCDVISSESGNDALKQIRAQTKQVDVIVSDYGLSEFENGIHVIQNINAHFGYDVPSLLITGDTSPTVLEEASKAGLKILHKPVNPFLLRRTLCRCLRAQAICP